VTRGAPLRSAVVLAAGSGSRLGSLAAGRPKGLVEVGGESLVGRSLRLLRERGVERCVLVTGYRAELYRAAFGRAPGVELVHNPDFATSGTLASLALARARVEGPFALLESDLFYEARALDALLGCAFPDATLASQPTAAGDEVFLEAKDARVSRLSKRRAEIGEVAGEFVGLTRISAALAHRLVELGRALRLAAGHEHHAYDTDLLDAAARERELRLVLVPDLLWSELDDASHWRRLHDEIAPAVLARERSGR